jgi:hypothetical protein
MVHPENEPMSDDVSDEMKERIRQSMEEYWPRLKAQAERSLRLAQEMAPLWATTAKVMVDAFVAEGFSEADALRMTLELIPKKSIS